MKHSENPQLWPHRGIMDYRGQAKYRCVHSPGESLCPPKHANKPGVFESWLLVDGVLRLLSSDQGSPGCRVNTATLLSSLCWWQNAWQTQLTEDRLTSTIWRYSPSWWGCCRGQSSGTCTQDLERDEYLCSACFLFSVGPSAYTMMSPTCRVALLTSINPI